MRAARAPADVVLIPAKGLADGKSRLGGLLDAGRRARLNRLQLVQTVRAAAAVFGAEHTCVVSACPLVEGVARAERVRFIRERLPGLNEALEHARATVQPDRPASIAVLPVDLPGVGEAALRELLQVCRAGEAVVVPDRAGGGTNFLRLPAACGMPFAYGEGSFARHVRLLAAAGHPPRVVRHTCLRDDLDEPHQLPQYARYSALLAT